jgi:phosphatidylserine decarboxylase
MIRPTEGNRLLTRRQVRVGMSVGHDPKSDPYRPDMRKDEKNITMEDRQEAKRRIEGSLAPDSRGYDIE